MTFLPIVARELRIAARRRQTYWGRVSTATVAVITAGLLLPMLATQFSIAQGKLLFSVLSTLAFGYCLLVGARATSDCISSEKREGTIGLLFLTDLRGYDVVWGKLVSCSLTAVYGLIAVVPVLALALLLGGVTLSEVGRMALLLLNTLFFSLAAGVFVSTLSRNDRLAMFAALCVIFLVSAAPFLIVFGVLPAMSRGGNASFNEVSRLLLPSPAFAFEILRSNGSGPFPNQIFYGSLLTTHVITWVLLGLAGRIVPRVCQERPPGRKGQRWLEFRKRWSYGPPIQRAAFRARLLDVNAFYWLAARDRIKAYYVWFFVAFLGLIWAWSGWMLASYIFDWDLSFLLLFMLFAFLKVWLISEVSSRMVEDRASGAFELLLSSPMQAKQMARGQGLALRRQFGRPVGALLGITGLLALSACYAPHADTTKGEILFLFGSLMTLLVADLITLKWLAMWHALTSSQIHQASLATVGRGLLIPTVLLLLGAGFYALLMAVIQPNVAASWHWGLAGAAWLLLGLTNDLFFGLRARWRFLHQFREIATQRFAAEAPRLEPVWEALAIARRRLFRQAEERSDAHRRNRIWRWRVMGPGLILLVAAVVLVYRKHVLSQQVAAKLSVLKATGNPVTLVQLQDWLTLVPASENAGILLEKAAPQLRRSVQWPKLSFGQGKGDRPGPLTVLSQQFQADASKILSSNAPALVLLQAAAQLPKCRLQLNWNIAPSRLAPSYQIWGLLPTAQLLELKILVELEGKENQRVQESFETLFGLARAFGQEPFFPAQQLRFACLFAAARSLERAVNQGALSPEHLRSLRDRLHEADITSAPDLSRAFVAERCLVIDELLDTHHSASTWAPPPAGTVQQVAAGAVNCTAWVLGVPERHLLDFNEAAEWLIQRAREVGRNQAQASVAVGGPPASSSGARRPQIEALTAYWTHILGQQTTLLFRMRALQLGMALEEFRAGHEGNLPGRLDELVPQFLPALPDDPFGPGLLAWKRISPGYIIFSPNKGAPTAPFQAAAEPSRANVAVVDAFPVVVVAH